MIEEVVKSILEAEDKAEKMVEQARVQAGQTAADAEAECDRIRFVRILRRRLRKKRLGKRKKSLPPKLTGSAASTPKMSTPP